MILNFKIIILNIFISLCLSYIRRIISYNNIYSKYINTVHIHDSSRSYRTNSRMKMTNQNETSPSSFNNNNNDNNNNNNRMSFLTPVKPFDPSVQGNNLIKQSTSKSIIPTGPESLAKIENDEKKYNSNSLKSTRSADASKYFMMVESLAPNEMLLKFAKTAPKNVQEAAKSTVMNIFGSMPNYALDAALVTTNTKLANLLYQMQITGYMFKNAEYRMSLTRMLKGLPKLPAPSIVKSGNMTLMPSITSSNTYTGQVLVNTSIGESYQVAVEDLTNALTKEISDLRAELSLIKNERENELKVNLLTYIQALPERDLIRLTSDMSEDIVASIQMLVDALMDRLGIDNKGPEVVIQQSVSQLAQLCMWQMVVGYKLRELEALDKGANLD